MQIKLLSLRETKEKCCTMYNNYKEVLCTATGAATDSHGPVRGKKGGLTAV